ncbi:MULTISPECIES: septum site-determining protein MinC [Legionella]|uniref:septum site-determining protein MinC n=1 Tax=Legionella TaxID=445 RepID=UPI000F8C6730|nr:MULTISPECIES: septum site-determining protein MinC [Legionella]MCP0912866.1 septum site-determining protein MinC [Legionella sp. 27cVA30]RUR09468.1 septum site-determining protein MinC [Legionella septentrionalis]
MTDNVLKSQAFKLKGRLYTLTVLSVLDTNIELFAKQLIETIHKAPRLFHQSPVVLDCSAIHADQLDFQALYQCVRDLGLIPVAIQGGNPRLEMLAQCQNMAVLKASSDHDKPVLEKVMGAPAIPIEAPKTRLLTSPVRSGQQIVSKGDLIVTAAVSHGAELLADGNIHVYGPLRGRALAGIDGNKQARIFCQTLEAELVSIAGFYRLSDAIGNLSGPCQIFLQDDHIQIEPL